MNNSVDFKKIKWGALTKQLKDFNAKNKKNFNLEQFSDFIIGNPKSFQPTTEKRALFYKNVLKGGKVSIGNLKSFIDNSYSKKPKENIDGYVIDKVLTNDIAKVYYHPQTGHAIITHRGTAGLKDWGNNVAYLTGLYEYTDRFKRGKKAQEETEKKYGKKNVSTLGHSQGAILSRKLGADTKEIINLNPAYVAEKPKKNEYNIKSSSDIVSKLKPIHKRDIEIKAETSNPLTEHSTDILKRLDENQQIGAGGKKFNFLKAITKVGTTLGKPFESKVGINPFTMGYDLGEKVIAPALMKVIPPKKGSGISGGNIESKAKTLKVYQIRYIIEEWVKQHPEVKLKGWKTGNKDKKIKVMVDNNINPSNYQYPQKDPKAKGRVAPPPADPRKKYDKKAYTPPEQQTFLTQLSKNPRHKNPLQPLEQYTSKEGKKEYLSLEKHQIDFIKQFVYSNLRGSIAFHGVGSGKTLTAVVSSYLYLKMYPKNKVIVITPSALLFNFINGMIQFGLDIQDNRYSFFTYDKYIRKPQIAKDALLIVDEAHNFRTQIITTYEKNEENEILEGTEKAKQNVRGYKLMEFGSHHAHKVLLLTGTAFVNGLYDIENLLSMIDNRPPIQPDAFYRVIENGENIKDYFNYKISYYKTSPTSIYFPEKKEQIIPIYMTEEQEKEYDEIKRDGTPTNTSDFPNNFYNAEMYGANMIDAEDNPKIQWIIDKVKATPNQKFIIYSTLYGSGVKLILSNLQKQGIAFTTITGAQSTSSKEENKRFFNGYNFGNPNFFTELDPSMVKYVNDKYRVLVITRAGAEGVDTINCQNVILLNSLWNDAVGEQIIARAIRFKSHFGLPLKERYVNVYRLLLAKPSNKELVDVLLKPNFNEFCRLKNEIREQTKKQLELVAKNENEFLTTIKALKALTYKTKDKDGVEITEPFIPNETQYKKVRSGFNKPMVSVQDGADGWDKYKEISGADADEKRKKWRIVAYSKWWEAYGKPEQEKNPIEKGLFNATADLMMFIGAKAKTENIVDFCNLLGNDISLFEKYQSALLPFLEFLEKKQGKKLTEEEQASIYAKLLQQSEQKLLRTDYKPIPKAERSKEEQLQEYFTNDALAKYILQKSSLKDNNLKIQILEPTAGDGALIRPILELEKDITIDMIEINRKNRAELQKMQDLAPNSLFLQAQINFLRFIPSKRYDYIFTNPPFHLRRSENAGLLEDVWDFDFIQRAYAMLKEGGELVGITGNHWMKDEKQKKWYQEHGAIIETKKGETFKPLEGRAIKYDVDIIKLVKLKPLYPNEDSDILKRVFYYQKDPELGALVNSNDVAIADIIEPSKKPNPEVVVKPQPDPEPEPMTENKKKTLGKFFSKSSKIISNKNKIKQLDTEINKLEKEWGDVMKKYNSIDVKDLNKEIQNEYKAVDLKPFYKVKGKPTYDDISMTVSIYKVKGLKYNDAKGKNKTEIKEKFLSLNPDIKIVDDKLFGEYMKQTQINYSKEMDALKDKQSDLFRLIKEKEREKRHYTNLLEDPNYKEKQQLKNLKEEKEFNKKIQEQYGSKFKGITIHSL